LSAFELEFSKALSANELGITNSHQAGLLVPKRIALLSYFPSLDRFAANPREPLNFYVPDLEIEITLNYIYYNNKDRGVGTRSEYRLTGTTKFFRQMQANPGQIIEFGYINRSQRAIMLWSHEDKDSQLEGSKQPFITTNGWKIVEQNESRK
jgi:Restriction endonuclease EcoRII, N-terminal